LFGFNIDSPSGATIKIDYGFISVAFYDSVDYGLIADAHSGESDYGDII